MISFDDAGSFCTSRTQLLVGYPLICDHKTVAKGIYIRDADLAGFAMFETGSDYKSILVSSILSAMNMTP
jgi:hypothetical protein